MQALYLFDTLWVQQGIPEHFGEEGMQMSLHEAFCTVSVNRMQTKKEYFATWGPAACSELLSPHPPAPYALFKIPFHAGVCKVNPCIM